MSYHNKIAQNQQPMQLSVYKSTCRYSKNNQNPSFVHGNIPTIGKDIVGSQYYFNFSQWNGFKNNTYILQNNFKSLKELYF